MRSTRSVRDSTAPTSGWGIVDVLGWWVLSFVGTSVWFVILIAVFYDGERPDPDPIGLLAAGLLVQWVVYLAGPALTTARKGRGPVADLGLAVVRSDLGVGMVIGVVLQLVVLPLVYWPILQLVDVDPSETAQELVDSSGGVLDAVLLTLVVAVMAPLVEEVFFRGFLLGALRRMLPVAAAVVVSAAAFALVHILPILYPGTFLLGLVAGWATVRTGRLGMALAMHFGFNLVTLVLIGFDLPGAP